MAPPPIEVIQWLKRTYPRPAVDPEWLEGCYTWIQEELHLSPEREMAAILENVNTQLLESDFADSMVAGTGIPPNAIGADNLVLKGPILVEVTNIMEIGHSAYSLLQVHESRIEYRKQSQILRANGDTEERKPMPKYPRSMLQLQLSDGQVVLPAIECKSLPQFELGETPLGFKLLIKDVTIRRGVAFLQPRCVELKGHRTADRDERRDAIFLRSLKLRMGEDVPEEDPPAADPPQESVPGTPPRDLAQSAASSQSPRSPLRPISPPLEPRAGSSNLEHADDLGEPRRRKRPSRAGRSPSPDPPPRRSHYFPDPSPPTASSGSSSGLLAHKDTRASPVVIGPGAGDSMKEFAKRIGLSPPRARPAQLPTAEDGGDASTGATREGSKEGDKDSDDEETNKGKGKEREVTPQFGEASSDDFHFNFDVTPSFLEQVDRVEQEYLDTNSVSEAARSQPHVPSPSTQTVVKAEPASQLMTATTKTLFSTSSAPRKVSAPGSHATSVPGISSTGGSRDGGAGDIITISDDDDGLDKENVPVQARHVRRRIVRPVDEDVIELSD